jgi:hypothetical protein
MEWLCLVNTRLRQTVYSLNEMLDSPMVELEAGTPVGCSQQGLHGAGQINEAVAHEEEHGEQRCQYINVSCFVFCVLRSTKRQNCGSERAGREQMKYEKKDLIIALEGLARNGCVWMARDGPLKSNYGS